MARVYLYAVTSCSDHLRLGPVGVGAPPLDVEVSPVDGLGIAFSQVTDPEYTPSVADIRPHQAVLDGLLPDCTVLPFSFGTMADDWAAVERFVGGARADFAEQIDRLRGRVEVGLKVFWKKDAIRGELARQGGFASAAWESGSAGTYNEAIRVGQAVERLVLQWRDRYVPQILAALTPLCEDVRESVAVSARMLWNASFLVRAETEPAVRAAAFDLDRRLGDRLDFRYAAPLPPYNFVSLRYVREDEA